MNVEASSAVDSRLKTKATELFGVDYPIVQTGMGWVAGPSLVTGTANAGGLGILAAATMTLEEMKAAVGEVKSRTDRPFGVNLRTDAVDVGQRIDHLIAANVKVASFAQAPRPDMVRKLKDHGLVVMPTVGARRHAEKVAEWGVDAVLCQGGEGGGHTGTVPTSLLLPQVLDAVDVPVIAAGGFHDGRGLAAALAWGADGIAMGTRFLLTSDSRVPAEVKDVYLGTAVTGTVVSTAIDGSPQRVVRTEVVDSLERAGVLKLPRAAVNALRFRKLTGTSLRDLLREGLSMKKNRGLTYSQVAMAANAAMLTRAAMVEGRLEAGILPTGQCVGVVDDLPSCETLITRIVSEASERLDACG
ncbi:MAG: nitronate monooxygenase [Acidimicrobiaceae bacterium]|nr:nitronate monooxygenase [Acidimicrobiaceae bacterium]MDE0606876.1 nitronate monooxygenase [Acidimicrobiaceae bacterium]